MEQVGYSLVNGGAEVAFWGDTLGQLVSAPDVIVLDNGDHVYCPAVGDDYQGSMIVPRFMVEGSPAGIVVESDKVTVTREPAPVPLQDEISDRQFFQGLALQNVITQDEALTAVKVGTIPAAMQTFVDAITDPIAHFNAEMLLCGATVFKRSHPLTAQFGAAQGWSPAQIDDFWRACTAL